MKILTSLFIVLIVAQQLMNCSSAEIERKKREADSTGDTRSAVKETTGKNQEQDSHHHHHPAKHWGYRNQDKSVLPKEWYNIIESLFEN